jgi:hypothetical protein
MWDDLSLRRRRRDSAIVVAAHGFVFLGLLPTPKKCEASRSKNLLRDESKRCRVVEVVRVRLFVIQKVR